MNRFPWIFGTIIALLMAGLSVYATIHAPAGTAWLGDGIENPSDAAVYFSYLRQGADGHVLLHNLFAVEPHRVRFDLVWSSLGLIARTGIPLVVLHESARAIAIFLLVLAVWYAARSLWPKPRDAAFATALAMGGISTGWIFSVWMGLHHAWTLTTYAAPDLATEFAAGPVMFDAVHIILSSALLITSVRLLWTGRIADRPRQLILGTLAGVALLFFHPYFTPIIVTMIILATILRSPWNDHKRLIELGAILACLAIPVAYYVWLLMDPVFGNHHLVTNILPLQTPGVWLITLIPFIIAFGWMWRSRAIPKKLEWTTAWIVVSVALLILPVPWKRKLLEMLLVPLVFVTMPAWFAVRDWVTRQPHAWMRRILAVLLLVAAWFGPIHLALSDIVMLNRTDVRTYFYRPTSLFEMSAWIHDDARSHVVLSDDAWTNEWLPSMTGKAVWVGHNHETPDYNDKHRSFQQLQDANSPLATTSLLETMGVTTFVTTTATSTAHFTALLSPAWAPVHQSGDMVAWEPTRP